MDFANLYAQGFVRVAARVVPVSVAQPQKNATAIIADAAALSTAGVGLAAYPELGLTGYTCEDLFLQTALLDAAEDGLAEIVEASQDLLPVIVVGVPLRYRNRLYNCAAVVHRGELLGVVPKSYLPTYREFYERRWFAAGETVDGLIELPRVGLAADFTPYQTFDATDIPDLRLHVAVCEDMWVPRSPSGAAALQGATVLVNISSSPITIGKAEDRKLLARATSLRANAAYLFTAAGPGESTTDLAWDGQTFVYECGELLGESERFPVDSAGTVVDVDLHRIMAERHHQGTFDDNRDPADDVWMATAFTLHPPAGDLGLKRAISRYPFQPADPARLSQDCYEAYSIQVAGLVQRMRAIGTPKLVLGVSGGLDSTHALIVAAKAMDLLGRPRSDILTFTMPGFATSDTTKNSALALMAAMGCTAETIDIRPAARQILTDLGHPFAAGEPVYDVTFENVQAGVRTDYLFRIANQRGGIVVGTGDLSELALGWCTYGVGDHMSHYDVNAGVPKTLIQHLIRWVIGQGLFDAATNGVLETVLGQEISPELVPAADGRSLQSTESLIGPYALHDFFLYHFLRWGERPSRIAYAAWRAWAEPMSGDTVNYDLPTIRGWLEFFLKRFFANQFKRSASPNGVKVSPGGSLSPRGDWRMPSDVRPDTWLRELTENVPKGV